MRNPTLIKCAACEENGQFADGQAASVTAPQSIDQGETVEWVPACASHYKSWWDGADWNGSHLTKPIEREENQ